MTVGPGPCTPLARLCTCAVLWGEEGYPRPSSARTHTVSTAGTGLPGVGSKPPLRPLSSAKMVETGAEEKMIIVEWMRAMDTCRGKVLDWVTGPLASEEETAAPEQSPQKRQVAQRPLLGTWEPERRQEEYTGFGEWLKGREEEACQWLQTSPWEREHWGSKASGDM